MENFILRTEELSDEQVKELYVATEEDEKIIEKLQSQSPVVLVGSRGMGKSFLFRMAQLRLKEKINEEKIFPVYVTFRSVPLLQTGNMQQFQLWMLNKICTTIIRELKKQGYIIGKNWNFGRISEENTAYTNGIESLIEINNQFENSWKTPGIEINTSFVPTIDDIMDIIEDICDELDFKRIVVFIDEAAHVFIPEQQRQFFSMFRDLRSSQLKCNASVYPGATFYGSTFEPIHDAVFVDLRRNIRDENYVRDMKQMVLNQIKDSTTQKRLLEKGEQFTVLAYASSGNPRILLKSVVRADNFRTKNIENVFREFYRNEIWSEHSQLVDKFPANVEYIDWGRKFIEGTVIPELKNKNDKFLAEGKETTAYFWIHRDSPQVVKESLRILEYTGIIKLQATGIKATGAAIGNRYEVNIGCLLSFEANPLVNAKDIIEKLSLGRMSEYGANSKSYSDIINKSFVIVNMNDVLKMQLKKSVRILELTEWQKKKLISNRINTIEDLLNCTETKLMQIYYVGQVKARQMKNAAVASIFEFLS